MKKLLLVLVFLLSTICATAQVNNYYVSPSGSDSNDGSQAHPWKTLPHASQAMHLGASGTTIHVTPGNYGDGSIFDIQAEGTATQPIVWISDTPLGAKINGDWRSGNKPDLSPGGDYNTIQGFDIMSMNNDEGILIGRHQYNGGGNFSKVLNNYVHDTGTYGSNNGPCGDDGAIAINSQTHDVLVDGNRINRSGTPGGCFHTSGNYYGSSNHGIYVAGYHNTVTNNIVSNVAGAGVNLNHNPCWNVISNNTIFHNFLGGINIGGDPDGIAPCATGTKDDYNTITNNLLVRNGYGQNCTGPGTPSPCYPHGAFAVRFYDSGGTHNKAFNNYMAGNFLGQGVICSGTGNSPTGGLANSIDCVTDVAPAPPPAMGANLGTRTNTNIFVNYQDDGSGDYQLANGSFAIGAGTVGSTACAASPGIGPCIPTTDFAGLPRANPLSIGAIEFGASATLPSAPSNLTAVVQ